MARRTVLAAGAIIVLLAAIFVWNMAGNAFDEQYEALEFRMAAVPARITEERIEPWPFAEWQAEIGAKPQLWTALVPVPPPPEVKPPPPPKPPNVCEMLKDITVSRRGTPTRVRIMTPQLPRGEYFGVGDVVNGCRIIRVEPGEVEFSFDWVEGRQTLTCTIARM